MNRQQVIKKKEEFTRIIQARQYVSDSSLALYYQPKAQAANRVGISVTTKLGTAVDRNRAKRQLRALIDELFNWQEEFDSIIIIRPSFAQSSYSENKKGLERCYKKVKMIKKKDKETGNEKTIEE